MATIKERAKEWSIEYCDNPYVDRQELVDLYTEIASEQRKIDINKACEWLLNRGVGNSWIDENFVKQFRKAMEE